MAAPASARTHDGRPTDRSIGELLVDLSDGTAQLVRQELELARTEAVESIVSLRRGGVWLGVTLVVALCAAGALTAMLITLATRFIAGGRDWLGALIVTVVLGVVALVCVRTAVRAFGDASKPPREAADSIKETVQWLKHPSRSAAS